MDSGWESGSDSGSGWTRRARRHRALVHAAGYPRARAESRFRTHEASAQRLEGEPVSAAECDTGRGRHRAGLELVADGGVSAGSICGVRGLRSRENSQRKNQVSRLHRVSPLRLIGVAARGRAPFHGLTPVSSDHTRCSMTRRDFPQSRGEIREATSSRRTCQYKSIGTGNPSCCPCAHRRPRRALPRLGCVSASLLPARATPL